MCRSTFSAKQNRCQNSDGSSPTVKASEFKGMAYPLDQRAGDDREDVKISGQ